MSLHPITLQTDKTITDFTKDFETVKQSEKGQVLQGTILNADKEPYDLSASGIYLVYCEQKSEGKMVIDKGNSKDPADDAGIMTITDAKNGKFSYKLCQQVYAATGDAWIEIYNGNNFVDSTESFRMVVEPAANIHYSNDNYVSDMANILTSLKAEFTRAKSTVDTLEKDVNDANSDVDQKLIALQKKVQGFENQYAEIQSNYDAAMKKITDQATADTQNAVKTISDQAKSDTQNAIKDINDQFTAKLNSLQSDYDSWKTSTTNDFQAKLDKLNQQLQSDETNQATLKSAIDSAKNAISKIKDVDFTLFAHKTDLDNYYTKTEVDAKVASAGKVRTVNNYGPGDDGNINIPLDFETTADAKKLAQKVQSNTDALSSKAAAADLTKLQGDVKTNTQDIAAKASATDLTTLQEKVNGNTSDLTSIKAQLAGGDVALTKSFSSSEVQQAIDYSNSDKAGSKVVHIGIINDN